LLFVGAAAAGGASAQAPALAPPTTSPCSAGSSSHPDRLRTGSGAPGRAYWQQRVDYVIKATLDTVAKAVSGEEQITYTNNSPDTLRYLWLQVDQNLFTDSSVGEALFPSSAAPTVGSASSGSGSRSGRPPGAARPSPRLRCTIRSTAR